MNIITVFCASNTDLYFVCVCLLAIFGDNTKSYLMHSYIRTMKTRPNIRQCTSYAKRTGALKIELTYILATYHDKLLVGTFMAVQINDICST